MRTRSIAAFLLSVAAVPSTFAAQGYLTNPAIHGDRIVFVSERDLWTARLPQDASAPIVASRLTNGAGLESKPVISPDGTKVAYAAEYEGNLDVYVMPIDGGAPTRLTYHPGNDEPLAWTRDGSRIAFRSPRANPLGRQELWFVDANGGIAVPGGFGECSMISFKPSSNDGSTFAFTRWSNENWNWKRYRGGTAPEIWTADLGAKTFANVTNTNANDLYPMWIGDRIVFLSDRDGTQNVWAMKPDGSGAAQITTFVNDSSKPTDPSTYELRMLSADAAGGPRVVASQAGGIVLIDTSNGDVKRLDIDLLSDRAGTMPRFVDALKNITAFSLSPKGDRVLVEARGELLTLPVGKPTKGVQIGARQITHESKSREWGATWLGDDKLACITDASGEQQIATLPADGSSTPALATTDRSQWLLALVASPDGKKIAFSDKDLRLWLFDVDSRAVTEVDRSDAGEIVDFSFSPDGAWLAWTRPMLNRMSAIVIRSTKDDTRIELSDGMTNDKEPRFDPKGEYLWFLSDRHIDPLITGPDFEFVIPAMTQVFAVPLKATTPPPSRALAAAAGFDLKAWASAEGGNDEKESESEDDVKSKDGDAKAKSAEASAKEGDAKDDDDDAKAPDVTIDAADIRSRVWQLPVDPGNYRDLTATFGGVAFLSDPTRGIADVAWPAPPLGEEIATLKKFEVMSGETKDVVDGIAQYAANRDGSTLAWFKEGAFHVAAGEGDKVEKVDASDVMVRVNPPAEWAQMLDETWRLQRDFYWAPNMAGVDWNAMRERYKALLTRAGTRSEAADVMGQLLSELGTSHTYIMGFDEPDRAKHVGVGLLGADLVRDGNAVRIASILPGRPGDRDLFSPLALKHLNVAPGSVLLSIDGRPVRPDRDPYELLQDRADQPVVLEIADDAQGNNRRTIEVIAISEDRPLRYAAWVDGNRAYVREKSGGTLGYVHIPDMDSEGLIEFSRTWFPQAAIPPAGVQGMVVDIRDNGGGWVSQLIVARVARRMWAYQFPRQGAPETYPTRTMNGPSVVLIDQNAGSDGDIFPESIRIRGLAPLIGTRTWGGVVGIRGDKPSMDLGVSTQPEFAWFDPQKTGESAWSVENLGVAPDIEVDVTPGDRMAKRDPQLDRGIEELLKTLKAHPPAPVPTAPFPNRAKAQPK